MGIAADIKVTFGDAAEINIGDTIELFCSSWAEAYGNVLFKKCIPYTKMISN